MNSNDTNSEQSCYFFYFGLIVTGKGEREFLTKLFRSLMDSGICSFEIIRKVEQRNPITSEKRKIKMVGTGKLIPDEDTKEIGLPARIYLSSKPCAYVLLIDDLEHSRADQAKQVFNRYREALDTILREQKQRASVHFLVNMLEAYYFANAEAINTVLGTSLTDYETDVETIRHPKGDLKQIYHGFDEIKHGGRIIDCIDIEYVLSRPDACASLRTLFAWCSKVLEKYPNPEYLDQSSTNKYRLIDGILSVITGSQLGEVE